MYQSHENSTLKEQTLNKRFAAVWVKNERLRKQHALIFLLTENEALKQNSLQLKKTSAVLLSH